MRTRDPIKTKKRRATYYADNKEKEIKNNITWTENNRDIRRNINNNFYHNNKLNSHFIIGRKIRSLMWYGLKKNNIPKTNKTFNILQFTIETITQHIEKQFEPWMTWSNSGIYDPKTWDDNDPTTWKWQIDHIIPHSDLPYTSINDENFKKCWALENLRPYSAKNNILDGTRKLRHTDKRGKNKFKINQ